uniref:Uncharacterized protein n=1 Tax=Gasterosteus aculeatus TaxID=69293 RepID=G3PB68_GASAC
MAAGVSLLSSPPCSAGGARSAEIDSEMETGRNPTSFFFGFTCAANAACGLWAVFQSFSDDNVPLSCRVGENVESGGRGVFAGRL